MNDIKGIIEDVEKSDLVSDKVIKKIVEIIGQEKWQEINDEKSDICTTTGELIITLKGIPDLEKENAELKDDNKVMADNYSKMEQKFYDNLTKAKEHIQTLISCLIDWVQEGDKDHCYITDAEQFLKDLEK